jgi:hypothetical protein
MVDNPHAECAAGDGEMLHQILDDHQRLGHSASPARQHAATWSSPKRMAAG